MFTVFKTKQRRFAWLLLSIFVVNLLAPTATYALTAGPTQPEVQAFQPAGTTDMVELFTGDFSYNIPLFELPGPNGGYPFNLSYQSGITLDQEASWVGLGWSLNPGAINRQMRGLPDEFKGDLITTKMAIDPNVTIGMGAGIALEIFGGAGDAATIGPSVWYNNYKGFGYSIDASIGYASSVRSGMTSGIRVGLDISLNPSEGANISPSLSLGGKMGEFGVRAGFNSRSGLDNVSFFQNAKMNFNGYKTAAMKDTKTSAGVAAGASAAITLAHPGYTPQVSMPMRNFSLSAKFNPGEAWWGLFAKGYLKGFYTEQWLKNNGTDQTSAAYGYLNHDVGQTDAKNMLDFNREKDGIVSKETPNLGIPSMTYDIYSVTGQGIGAMYRPIRNDIGILRDPEVVSESGGASIGIDAGPWASHIGVNLSVNQSRSTSGAWKENNAIAARAAFQSQKADDAFEPWNFKVHGELTSEKADILNNLGGTNAVRVRLDKSNEDQPVASEWLERKGWSQVIPQPDRNRKQRNEVIQPITNQQLLSGTSELLLHYKNNYISGGSEPLYVRSTATETLHHFAGFTATTGDGLRYNYTIPVYNNKQEEVVFSTTKPTGGSSKVNPGSSDADPTFNHEGTEKFLKRVMMPKYAHAYLLTSILGADYVDRTNDGVTEDDLGYWVKFTYERTATDYKWRDPFLNAHFIEGWKSDERDDKGSYSYGEKELWYLRRAETKTHIAYFTIANREDGIGVAQRVQNAAPGRGNKPVSKLTQIKLISRATPTFPIKTVNFTYDNSLCPGIPNSTNNTGKLTLKSVGFVYGAANAHLKPYEFTYDPDPLQYAYNQDSYDRWGMFRPIPAGRSNTYNINFPYSDQNPADKTTIDARAAAWSLKQIKTPSGSQIIVDYETDDYGYVQHKTAMQMATLVNPYTDANSAANPAFDDFDLDPGNANYGRVRFKLEHPIPNFQGTMEDVVKSYIGPRGQIFFKTLINLRTSTETSSQEYVSGYADVDYNQPMTLEVDNTNQYVYGTFFLKLEGDDHDVHPFTMRAWQHLRTNQPEMARTDWSIKRSSSNEERVGMIRALGKIFTDIHDMFSDFYEHCESGQFSKRIKATHSVVRLNSQDKIKYGGGLRVSQITLKDNWQHDQEGIYGQVYDYTIEENGKKISSGVAAYEPMIGGEENALRYAKSYTQSVPLRSDNNLFFEYPVNESYYPGPQVGYRKVTVTSLAASALDNNGKPLKNVTLPDGQSVFPHGTNITYGTTGKVVHEYFTAKDFPVIADETDKDDAPFGMSIPIPFLGNVSVQKMASTQGYSIVTNDMHGKLKQVSNYRQDKFGNWEPEPIGWTRYNYASEGAAYQGETVRALNSTFVRNQDAEGTLSLFDPANLGHTSLEKYTMGQENEFFLDMREHEDNAWEGGINLNTDVVFLPFLAVAVPVPTIWPSIGKSTSQVRTAVTNKVIFKPGILESVEAYDGGSQVKTQNLKWDRLTGQVVLATSTNNFDNLVYSYNIPAYSQYKGLGPAYQNTGLKVKVRAVLAGSTGNYYFSSSLDNSLLYPGDEMILYTNDAMTTTVGKAIYMGERGNMKRISSPTSLIPLTTYTGLIVRSGFRNHLKQSAGTITGLQDPTVPGSQVTYDKVVVAPSNP